MNPFETGFLRLPQIVGPHGIFPIGKSTWWAGVKSGRFPRGIKLGPNITAWRRDDVRRLMESFERANGTQTSILENGGQ